MRRFENILRILSSVLLGTLVRDFDSLSGGIKNFFLSHNSSFFSPYAPKIATFTAIVLIGVYLRNIHASACYDDFIEARGYVLKIDRRLRWRITSFGLGLLSLFGAPVAGHIIAHHLPDRGSRAWLTWCLFLPFAVYFIWDIILYLADPEPSSENAHLEIEEISRKWLRIDAAGLFLVAILLIYNLYLEGYKQVLPTEVIAAAFILIAVGTIFADYLWNNRLYFPAYSERSANHATVNLDEHLDNQIRVIRDNSNEKLEALADFVKVELLQQQFHIDQKFAELTIDLNTRRPSYKVLRFFRGMLRKFRP